jgi:hypothetical protein
VRSPPDPRAVCVGPARDPRCVFIIAVPVILFAWGEGSGGHVLRKTRSRGLCGLVCPSRTSERGGEGNCVKEGGGGEGECERERALGLRLCHSPRLEVDPQRRRFVLRESDFALQLLVECRAIETKRVRVVTLRRHSTGSEVRLGLPVGL